MDNQEWTVTGPAKTLMSRAEVAKYLGLHVKTLEELIARGEFPAGQLIGSRPTWSGRDIAAWLHLRGRFRTAKNGSERE